MQEVKETKYLGFVISTNNNDSIHKTVTKRIGLAKQAVLEIRTIIEDSRASRLGGINVAFQLWESCVLSFLLYSSETWDHIPKKTIRVLNDYFNYFFRKIFRICSGAPIPNFYWQTGFLKAGNMILQKKLLFCHHLSNLEAGSLVRQFYDLQCINDLPGLYSNVREHLVKLGIPGLKNVSKGIWKKMVKA